jgi:hypothetical protein
MGALSVFNCSILFKWCTIAMVSVPKGLFVCPVTQNLHTFKCSSKQIRRGFASDNAGAFHEILESTPKSKLGPVVWSEAC